MVYLLNMVIFHGKLLSNQMLFFENHLKLRSRFFSLKIEDPAHFSKCRQSCTHFYIIYPPVNEQFQRAKLPMNVDHFPRNTMFFSTSMLVYSSWLQHQTSFYTTFYTSSKIIKHNFTHHQKSLNIILHIILHIMKHHETPVSGGSPR